MADNEGAAQVFKEVKISFEEFEESFNRYANRLKETEALWRSKMGIWKSMAGGVSQMESSMNKLQKSTKGWSSELQNAARNLTTLGGQWNNLQRLMRSGFTAIYRTGQSITTGGTGGPLAVATGSIIKAFGVAGKAVTVFAETAIGLAASIFALSREGAARGRRAAGFGADVGSMTAAEIYMQRWVNPDAAMANAAQGRYDITSPQYVAMRAGLGMRGSFQGRETGALSEEMVRKTAEIMHRGSDVTALSIAHARGLGSLFSDEELIRLRNSNEKQIQEYIKEAASKKSQYELTKEQIEAEQKLITEIGSLEATFTTQMQKWVEALVPKLTSVVTSIENLIKAIDGWKDWWKSWIPKGSDKPLTKDDPGYIPPPEEWSYPSDWWKKFKGLFSHISFDPIGSAQAEELKPGASPTNPLSVEDKALVDFLQKQALEAAGNISTASLLGRGAPASLRARGTGNTYMAGGTPDIKNLVETKSIDPAARAFLDTIAATESAGSYAIVNPIGARGRYQFMPGTWAAEARKLGFDPKDWSHKNQDLAAFDLASTEYRRKTGRDMVADLKAGNVGNVLDHLGPNPWEGLSKHSKQSLIERFKRQLDKENTGDTSSPLVDKPGSIRHPKGGQTSMNDLNNFQGAYPKHFIHLAINNQAGANTIVSGGILGAGKGSFRVG